MPAVSPTAATLHLAMLRLAQCDDQLGRECHALTDGSDARAREALIAIATAHMMAADRILRLVMPADGVAQCFYAHADRVAIEATEAA